jgi:hypothetical protein
MVKNTKGGSGHKSLSRKSQISSTNTIDSIIKPQSPLEFFAIVTQFFGNTASVIDSHGSIFRCFIRGKFRGRNKRNFIVAPSKLVLVSKRHFESDSSTNVDLLTVYDSHDISLLLNFPSFNLSSLFHTFSSLSSSSSSSPHDILFDYSSLSPSTHHNSDNLSHDNDNNTSHDNNNLTSDIDNDFFDI